MLQIEDEKLAFDFDFACTLRLKVYDDEIERRRLEATATGSVASLFGSPQVSVERSGVPALDA